MRKRILIPLTQHDRLEEITPYLKEIVQAGTRVVFLVRYAVAGFQLLCLSDVEAMQAGAPTALTARYSFEVQQRLAEQRIFPAREALEKKGVEVVVDCYTGSLREALRNYAAREDVHLIVMATGVGSRCMRFVGLTLPLFGFSQRRNIPPVLLHYLDLAA